MATMVTTMADLDMTKDFDYARYQFVTLLFSRLQLYFSALRRWTDCCSVPLTLSHTFRHLWVFFMITRILKRTRKILTACKGAFNCVCRVSDQQSSAPLLPAVRDPWNWHQVCLSLRHCLNHFLFKLKIPPHCPGPRFASWPLRCACTWASWATLGKLLRMFSTDWSTTCHWWAPLH